MPYIGSAVTKTSDLKRITFATSTTGAGPFDIGWTPDSLASLRATINGVVQHDITISGSNLTLGSGMELVSGDELEVVGIVHTGGQMIPMDGSVSLPKIARAGTAGQVLMSSGTGADVIWGNGTKYIEKSATYAMSASDFDECEHLFVGMLLITASAEIDLVLPVSSDWAGKQVTCMLPETGSSDYFVDFKRHASDGGTSFMQATSDSGSSTDPHLNTYCTVFSTGTYVVLMGRNFTEPD